MRYLYFLFLQIYSFLSFLMTLSWFYNLDFSLLKVFFINVIGSHSVTGCYFLLIFKDFFSDCLLVFVYVF